MIVTVKSSRSRRKVIRHTPCAGYRLENLPLTTANSVCRILVPILAAVPLAWCSLAESAEPATPTPAAKDIFFLIPHTHWEGAVFLTREEYLDVGLPNILRAIQLLKAHPNYRFTAGSGLLR